MDTPSDVVNNELEIKNLYRKYLSDSYEGVIIKSAVGKYQRKRVTESNGAMLKLKPFKSLDLKVKEIYAGEDNFEGKAGGVIVDHGGHAVRVGSGFDVATRDLMAAQPHRFIGKTAEIKYFEETEDGSLRFPIWLRWREDK